MYSGPVHCISSIYQHHGLRGCFYGFNITMLREIPAFGVYFASYAWLCDHLKKENKDKSAGHMVIAGGIAGMLSWIINIPVDVVKSRIQADNLSNPRFRSMWHCAMLAYRAEGMRVFWRGLPITCLRAFPTNAVTFPIYEKVVSEIQKSNTKPEPQDGPTVFN